MKRIVILTLIIATWIGQAVSQEKLKPAGTIPVMSWGGISQKEVSVQNYLKLKNVGVNIDIAFFQDDF